MKIFNDKYYENPDSNAFLNWRTDAAMFSSFYEVGVGYLSSAIITLSSIIEDNNAGSEADSIIFPIMFNLWHGIELLLKSGILMIREINNTTNMNDIKSHNIKDLYDKFVIELDSLNLTKPQNDLSFLKELLDEFDSEDVNFDAFRYPYDSKWGEQFYNKPQSYFVENKCINLPALQEKCIEIILSLPIVIKYFDHSIFGDLNDKSFISDDTYTDYTNSVSFDESDFNENDDSMKKLLKFLRILL